MSLFKNPISLTAGAVLLSCAASPAWAAATVCNIDVNDDADATIAVASNFYQPAISYISTYTSTVGSPGNGKKIRVCHNSTGTLLQEINGTIAKTAPYSLLLAANASTPNSLASAGTYTQSGATAETYAWGIPVLAAMYATVPSVSTLIPALASGQTATISSTLSSTYALNTATSGAASVAEASPSLAPYGLAGANIMYLTNGWNYTTDPIPSWMHSPLYDNIDLTFASIIDGTNRSGFVSKAQLCSPPSPLTVSSFTYAEFTNSAYMLNQKGVLLASGDTTEDAVGASLWNYMLSTTNRTAWNSFLTSKCYGTL